MENEKSDENNSWEGLYNSRAETLRREYLRIEDASRKGEILSSLERIIEIVSKGEILPNNIVEKKSLEEKARNLLHNPDISRIKEIYSKYPLKEVAQDIGTSVNMVSVMKYELTKGEQRKTHLDKNSVYMRFAHWLLEHGYESKGEK